MSTCPKNQSNACQYCGSTVHDTRHHHASNPIFDPLRSSWGRKPSKLCEQERSLSPQKGAAIDGRLIHQVINYFPNESSACEKRSVHECIDFIDEERKHSSHNGSTLERKLSQHMRSCPINKTNACQYCGFTMSAFQKPSHESCCASNPVFAPQQCHWCNQHIVFSKTERNRAVFWASVKQKLRQHLNTCPKNKDNACQYCGLICATWEKESHELSCSMQQQRSKCPRSDKKECKEWQFLRSGRRLHSHLFNASSQTSRPSQADQHECTFEPRHKQCTNSKDVIHEIETQLSKANHDDRRKTLRALQLKYHPDKYQGNWQFGSEVFHFVQSRWEAEFKK